MKFNFYNKKFSDCKSDTKKVWGLINKMLGRKKQNFSIIFTSPDASHNLVNTLPPIASKLVSEDTLKIQIQISPSVDTLKI